MLHLLSCMHVLFAIVSPSALYTIGVGHAGKTWGGGRLLCQRCPQPAASAVLVIKHSHTNDEGYIFALVLCSLIPHLM